MESEVKTIKGVSVETWIEFKALAAKKRLPMGKLLSLMVEEYKRKKADEFWDAILSGERNISDRETEEMHIFTKKLRKEWGYRK